MSEGAGRDTVRTQNEQGKLKYKKSNVSFCASEYGTRFELNGHYVVFTKVVKNYAKYLLLPKNTVVHN